MNKQELQKRYQEIVLKTNGGNDDYVVALCKIASAINDLEDTKDLQQQLDKSNERWEKLKEWASEQSFQHDKGYRVVVFKDELQDKMQELEGEKDE